MIVIIRASPDFSHVVFFVLVTIVLLEETKKVSSINIIFVHIIEMSLSDRVAIVTGSSKGIGFEIANEFSKRGAIVIVCSRNFNQSKTAAEKISGLTLALEVDVTDQSSVNGFVNVVLNRYQKIDILVNNSGYPYDATIWDKKIHEGSSDELEKIIDVDLF